MGRTAVFIEIMPSNKSEVEAFLLEAKQLVKEGRRSLVKRRDHINGLFELDITEDQGWDLIARLTVNNYSKGPEEDRDRHGTYLWFFGATVGKKSAYIKLKIEDGRRGRSLICLSLHPPEHPIRFPLRPNR